MTELLKNFFLFFGRQEPLSIVAVANKSSRPSPTSKLFIIRTDFPVSPELAISLNAQLEPLRQKFGLDFFVMEPGVTLTRFDDI